LDYFFAIFFTRLDDLFTTRKLWSTLFPPFGH